MSVPDKRNRKSQKGSPICTKVSTPTSDEGSKDHGDGHEVLLLEQVEQVVLDEDAPPTEVAECSGNKDSERTAISDEQLVLPGGVLGQVAHLVFVRFLQSLTCRSNQICCPFANLMNIKRIRRRPFLEGHRFGLWIW